MGAVGLVRCDLMIPDLVPEMQLDWKICVPLQEGAPEDIEVDTGPVHDIRLDALVATIAEATHCEEDMLVVALVHSLQLAEGGSMHLVLEVHGGPERRGLDILAELCVEEFDTVLQLGERNLA